MIRNKGGRQRLENGFQLGWGRILTVACCFTGIVDCRMPALPEMPTERARHSTQVRVTLGRLAGRVLFQDDLDDLPALVRLGSGQAS